MSSLDLAAEATDTAPEPFTDSVRRSALAAARQIEDPRWKAVTLTRAVREGAVADSELGNVASEALSAALEVGDPRERASVLLDLVELGDF